MIGTEYRKKMLERSLVSTGNNNRMKSAIKKAGAGEDVNMVFLGGSITDGYNGGENGCFAKLACESFRNHFGENAVINYINSGYPAANSTLGLIRVEEDVIKYRPDIVFVDFAVNDTKEGISREVYESLVRRLLKSESKPAVVLLFMISEMGYTCQGHMQAIGEYYSLPMISCGDALLPEVEANRMEWPDFLTDNIHPNENGHKLMAEFIIHYLERVIKTVDDLEYGMPKIPFYGNSFENLKLLDASNAQIASIGSFNGKDTSFRFHNGWKHTGSSGEIGFMTALECKNLFAVYKERKQADIGSIEIHIDGKYVTTLQGYSSFGFDNPAVSLIFKDNIKGRHQLEIRMVPGDSKKEFSLLALAYSC